MILAGDVGGTKILLEAGDFRSGRWQPLLARRYLIADFPHFSAVIDAFLADWKEVRPPRSRFSGMGVGIAGPVADNRVKMTNSPWTIDGNAIARRFGFPHVAVVNDLAAAAHGIELLSARDMMTLQPGRAALDAPRVVLGVGTGLGVAYLVPSPEGYEVMPGEGGHIGFSPASDEQAELWRAIFRRHGRVEAEDLVSGQGISNIYEVLRSGGECPPAGAERAAPAWVSQSAFAGDRLAGKAMDLFAECLGNVAGDHALAAMARGGVYLAGGVAAKVARGLNIARFRAAFCAKRAFSGHMMKIPVRLVTDERLALIGAARVGSGG